MTQYVTGNTIKTLREKKGFSQKQLAEQLLVSDKTISKWETQKGLPDITLLEPLAKCLSVSLTELLSGECMSNNNRAGNMLRTNFYVCPVCQNIIWSAGQGAFSCCGITLPVQEAELPDETHDMIVERIDNEFYVRIAHEMKKEHYISFIAYVTSERVQLKKLYPEQSPEARLPICGSGNLYAFCNHHGLFALKNVRARG